MKHLLVYAHPNPNSFNHAILDTSTKALEAKGHEVTVRDLYQMNFNAVLTSEDMAALRSGQTPEDIRKEQDYIAGADCITFIYPVWWTGLPAILKGYVDRVLSYGFAYAYGSNGNIEKLLTGKKGLLISTHGTPSDIYESIGMTQSLKQTSDGGIFDFCGIEVVNHLFFGSVPQVDDAARKGMLAQVEQTFQTHF
ncbi:NAD(P)H-dependent oxidoreductase [Paenibacillus sedimenti]|uniref:NAD(P)H-dependent oxidoreductase n=1 Tax=Paenibacillus sedimenti TaxID=2770274 RepID=A0A926KV88_9BACL|nr:NAD(P)H-dependent oxidoreductase [Paenibacillus sedimenti]MBD0382754.1 NAD(P)H-dependent oxidoreductase [Paenibacillus sedimenti]